MRRTLAISGTLGAFGAAMLGSSAAAAPLPTGAVVATTTKATPIDAGRGVAAFSLYETASSRYRLAVSDGTSVRLLKASPRRTAFDASVGIDATGRTVVTYTQCRRPTRGTNQTTYSPYWPEQTGCRVRSADVATGKTRTVAIQKTKGQSVWLPVQAGRSIAYGRLRDLGVRRTTSESGGEASRDRVHRYRFEVVRQDGAGRTKVLRGGAFADAPLSEANGQDLGGYGAGVTSLDFDGTRTAYTWEYASDQCPNQRGGPARPHATAVYLERGAKRARLARSCRQQAAGFLSNVDLQGSAASWLRLAPGTSTYLSSPFAATGATGTAVEEAPIVAPAPASVVSSSADGQHRWYVLTDGKQVTITRTADGA